jgi:hypothetical protein
MFAVGGGERPGLVCHEEVLTFRVSVDVDVGR